MVTRFQLSNILKTSHREFRRFFNRDRDQDKEDLSDFVRGLVQIYGEPSLRGVCLGCGQATAFFGREPALYREELVCGECGTTSRYRSIARGLLQAIEERTGVWAASLAALPRTVEGSGLKIYDTQRPFSYKTCAYPIPDWLSQCGWIEVALSVYRPDEPWGSEIEARTTNQNLEALTFPDATFDILITSDVMEHVRLDDHAHCEIRRVLKPGGVYIFTVPHFRHQRETFVRVAVSDPADPSKDQYLTEKEYHGDANSPDGRALSYRSYGTELDEKLRDLGFTVTYSNQDQPELGLMNTELFYCRLVE